MAGLLRGFKVYMMEVVSGRTSVDVDGASVPAHFCLPAKVKDPLPVVVVLHGSDGFKPNHRKIAEKLAGEGFAAFAPVWFGADPARKGWEELRQDDVLAAVSDFVSRPEVDRENIGFMGFSRGGGIALYFASLLPYTRAIVNYFGLTSWEGGLAELPNLPINPEDPLDFVQNIGCPVLSLHGDSDTVVPVENTYELDKACKRYNVEHEVVIYPGVDHSFIWDDSDNEKYDRAAHIDSWNRAIGFLKRCLFVRCRRQ